MKTINYTEIKEISGKMYHVAHIEINRPKQLNALNANTINDLSNKLNEIQNNSNIRSVIITAAGERAFVAGADIKEFQNFNKKEALDLSMEGKTQLFKKIKHFPKPVISGIQGFALGGGLELALATHIRVAGPSAKLGLPECSLGLIPGYSGTQELPRIIGVNRAMELILTAQPIQAEGMTTKASARCSRSSSSTSTPSPTCRSASSSRSTATRRWRSTRAASRPPAAAAATAPASGAGRRARPAPRRRWRSDRGGAAGRGRASRLRAPRRWRARRPPARPRARVSTHPCAR